MILLRFLSAALGAMVLVAAPFVLFAGTGAVFADAWQAFASVLALALVAGSFFFVGFAGREMKKSPLLRAIGAGSLAIPFIAACMIIWRGGDVASLWASGTMLCFTILLFVVFVVPDAGLQKRRQMREREPVEPRLMPMVRVQ
jgi:peptidoglycan/LPS O-acetylase OafA/YrhL